MKTEKIKYSDNLEWLASKESYHRVTEDEIFNEIEELEKRFDNKKAANLLSIYVNFRMPKHHKILINKSRLCVKWLIEANLVNFQEAEGDAVYISRRAQTGIQTVYNYTL